MAVTRLEGVPHPPAPRLRRPVSVACALLLAVMGTVLFVLPRGSEELDRLRFPGESAGRMMDRHLEFYEGYASTPEWQRALFSFLFGAREQASVDAVRTYREVLSYFRGHPAEATPWAQFNTRARLLVTLAETGQWQALEHELADFDATLDEEVVQEAVRFAYTDRPVEAPVPEILYGVRLLPLGWAADRLSLRAAERLGNARAQVRAERRLRERGARWRARVLILSAVMGGLLAAGWALLLWHHPTRPAGWQHGAVPAPWGPGEGFAVFVRAALLGLMISAAGAWWTASYFRPGLLASWSTLFASLPLLWLVHRHLLRPRGLGFVRAFGLTLRGVGVLRFARITLGLLALEWTGSLVLAWLGWTLGLQSHWSEGLYEQAVFGPWEAVFLSTVNLVLWTPIFEELGFRGLVQGTLRTRLGPAVAIVTSALLFSALHLYSLAGFLAVFWSGLVLAYAYERYRSLLPGMVVHAASNLLAISPVLLFYR